MNPNNNSLPDHNSIMDKIREFFGSEIHYGDGMPPEPPQKTIEAHPAYQFVNPPENMIGAFKGAYKANPDVAPGSLEALAMQESSMGTNKSQYNSNNGKYGYLFGLTPGAFTDTGFKPSDANTMEGAANVAAKYYSMRSKLHGATGDVIKTYTTPSDIYNRYTVTSAHPKTTFDEDKYNAMVDYYKNLQTNPAPMADNAQ